MYTGLGLGEGISPKNRRDSLVGDSLTRCCSSVRAKMSTCPTLVSASMKPKHSGPAPHPIPIPHGCEATKLFGPFPISLFSPFPPRPRRSPPSTIANKATHRRRREIKVRRQKLKARFPPQLIAVDPYATLPPASGPTALLPKPIPSLSLPCSSSPPPPPPPQHHHHRHHHHHLTRAFPAV